MKKTSASSEPPKSLLHACYHNKMNNVDKLIDDEKDQKVLKQSLMYCLNNLNFTVALQIANKVGVVERSDIKIFCLLFRKIIRISKLEQSLIDRLINIFTGDKLTLFIWAISCNSIWGCEHMMTLANMGSIDPVYNVSPLVHAISRHNKDILMNVLLKDINLLKTIDMSSLVDAICASLHNDILLPVYITLMNAYLERDDMNEETNRKIIFNTVLADNYTFAIQDTMIENFFKQNVNFVLSALYSSIPNSYTWRSRDYANTYTDNILSKIKRLDSKLVFDHTINHSETNIPLLCYIVVPQNKCITDIEALSPHRLFKYTHPSIDISIYLPDLFTNRSTGSRIYDSYDALGGGRHGRRRHGRRRSSDYYGSGSDSDRDDDRGDDWGDDDWGDDDRKDDESEHSNVLFFPAGDLPQGDGEDRYYIKLVHKINNTEYVMAKKNNILNYHISKFEGIDLNPTMCGKSLLLHYLENIYSHLDRHIDPSTDLSYLELFSEKLHLYKSSINPYISAMIDNIQGDTERTVKAVSILRLLRIYGYDIQSLLYNNLSFILSSRFVLKSMISLYIPMNNIAIHDFMSYNEVDEEVMHDLLDLGFLPTEDMLDRTVLSNISNQLYMNFIDYMQQERTKWNHLTDRRLRRSELFRTKNRWYKEFHDRKTVEQYNPEDQPEEPSEEGPNESYDGYPEEPSEEGPNESADGYPEETQIDRPIEQIGEPSEEGPNESDDGYPEPSGEPPGEGMGESDDGYPEETTEERDNYASHFISSHGSIVTDSYFCLPPNIGIMVLAKRGSPAYDSHQTFNMMADRQTRDIFIQEHKNSEEPGITYYRPGSIIQDQSLQFEPNLSDYVVEYDPDYTYKETYIYPMPLHSSMGIITKDVCNHLFKSSVFITDAHIQRNERHAIPITDGQIKDGFITYMLDRTAVRDHELMCNDEELFTKDELWNMIDQKKILLSDVIYRAWDKGISGDFVLLACRTGDIWGDDLHVQACREFARQHVDEKLETNSLEMTKLARQQSFEIASYNFYENMRMFLLGFYENHTSIPRLDTDKKTLYIGNIKLAVSTTILNRYREDKKMSDVKYAKWHTIRGKRVRVINKEWYRMFEKNIMNHLNKFLENMTNRIQNCLPIHTVEYCRLYALINGVLPYISTESLVCLTKRDYIEICMRT